MSRDIKFRAWDVSHNCWHTGEDFHLNLDGEVRFNIGYFGKSKCDYNCRDQCLMQFTGLTDKNGKEVYEGDIIKEVVEYEGREPMSPTIQSEAIGIVQWNDEQHRWEVKRKDRWGEWNESYHLPWTGHQLEVVGNVRENPELLR